MPVDLVHVRSFLEVVERGTVVAAATSLGYTAPAVSQHVAKLERSMGVTLFDRAAGHLRVSAAGAALVPLARDLLTLADRADAVVRTPLSRPHVTIVGFASAIGQLVVPVVDRLAEVAVVTILEAEDDAALREVRLGHADIALVQEYPGDAATRDRRLHYDEVVDDTLRLVVPASLPRSTTVADVAGLPWIINGRGTRCAAATHDLLRRAGVNDPQISGDVTDNETLLALVAAGFGVTIVPELVLRGAVTDITIADEPLGVTRSLVAVMRQAAPNALGALIEALRSPPSLWRGVERRC